MIQGYELYIADQNGVRIAGPLLEAQSLEWALKLNDEGTLTAIFSGADVDPQWLQRGLRMHLYRMARNGVPRLLQQYFIDDFGGGYKSQQDTVWIRGHDLNTQLTHRIVVGNPESAEAQKTGEATAVMEEYAEEALLTDTGRDISGEFTLTTEIDAGGETITHSAARGILLSVLQGCAKQSAQLGTSVRFWVAPNGVNSGVLRIMATPWGIEREGIAFSPELGTLEEFEWSDTGSDSANFAYIGGQGQKDERTITTVDASSSGALDRREIWLENTQISLVASLQAWGRARLYELRPRQTYRAVLADTELTAFGLDWDIGDLITIAYRERIAQAEVLSVIGRVDEGGDHVQAVLEGSVG